MQSLIRFYALHEAPNDYYRFTTYGIKYQCEKNGLMVELLTPMGGVGMLFARHGRALTGASPKHAQIVGSV